MFWNIRRSKGNRDVSPWERSSTYRKAFMNHTKGPYRCRYCNRWLKVDYMVVDHIVPVAKAKRSILARWILKVQGIENVNDPKNLCAACQKCNRRKGAKGGLWLVRGWLGKYRLYWPIYSTLKMILVCFAIVYVLKFLTLITSSVLYQWLLTNAPTAIT